MGQPRQISLALALAAFVWLAYVTLRFQPRDPAHAIAPQGEAQATAATGTEPPSRASTVRSMVDTPQSPAATARAPRVLLECKVVGMRPTPGGLQLTLTRGIPAQLVSERTIDGDGVFELDLSEALQGAVTQDVLSVGLVGAGHLSTDAAPKLRDDGSASGDTVYFAELNARPIERTLRGRLVDDAGEPITGIALSACIEFVAASEGPRPDDGYASVSPDRNGRFEMPLASDAAGQLSAIAWGFRARSRALRSDELGDIELGDFALSRGALISGTATGKTATWPRDSVVLAMALEAPARDDLSFRFLQSRDGVLHHALLAAPIGQDGSLVLAGLEPDFPY